MTENSTIITHGPEQTWQIGSIVGELAQPGELILLVGELGTGKTCFVQGIAWALGVEDYASSPSFVLAREYKGRISLYHIDLYRLNDIEEISEVGLDDYLYAEGICVVEWAEKALTLFPQEHLLISFEHLAENERRLNFEPRGEKYINQLVELKKKWNSL